jgi:hypothetical protein
VAPKISTARRQVLVESRFEAEVMKLADRAPTALLLAWSRGDQAAFDELIPLIHDELHRIARRHMRLERTGHTLQATALVNEAYLRLIDVKQMKWQNRAHFLAMAARVMRRIDRSGGGFRGPSDRPPLGSPLGSRQNPGSRRSRR